jgi:type III secretion protein N (ATPase)
VRVIDGLNTCAVGQRIGIFAGAGVGKSTLLGMIARHASADVVVVALIGERGREVKEFLDHELPPGMRERAVVVCATSDRPAAERAKAVYTATAIAEHFRDEGAGVLLLVDSLTRFARAQREIGLACGEPPTRRAFPPSVFAALPKLVERAGTSERGAITAFYTVLIESDSMDDPIGDEVRSLLDGHLVLSRELAAGGCFPAVDVLASVSRVMPQLVDDAHMAMRQRLCRLLAKHKEVELLVQIGEYKAGSDPLADAALAKADGIRAFVAQARTEASGFGATKQRLGALVGV